MNSLRLKTGSPHPVVLEGKVQTAVVTADHPAPVAAYAAQELVRHVETATGIALPILCESQEPARGIYVGDTRAARAAGIQAEALPPDAFVLRTVGNALFVVGREEGEHPMGKDGYSGTLFGVYELLDRFVQVRWLWPGALGTFVPRTSSLVIDAQLDEVVEPAFRFRNFRWNAIRQAAETYDPRIGRLAFSEAGIQAYAADLGVYLRRHRLGQTHPKPRVGHHFAGWWERLGKDHPAWFMMREDGQRGPGPGESTVHVAMCVSNPELHRYIVDCDWDGGAVLSLGEVDRRVFCQCDACKAWDAPQPANPPVFARDLYHPQMVTDRYARFWKTIQEMASKRNPNVLVTSFLYWNYMPAPLSDIALNAGIYGEFVPWGQSEVVYFPLKEDPYAWVKAQWSGWARKGITMAYRPNDYHGGYVMPHLSTRQAGDFFKFAHQNGMIGFDFDSLYGHWATKGPMIYMHMRLSTHPEMEIEQIRGEFFSAFGPAARDVERYFDYWEEYAAVRPGSNLFNPVDAHIAFPLDVFPPAEEMLEAAQAAVRQHPMPEFARRVAFLQAGLTHAKLASRFMSCLDMGALPVCTERLRKAREALEEMVAFRRSHEHLYIADFHNASARENRRIDIDGLLGGG